MRKDLKIRLDILTELTSQVIKYLPDIMRGFDYYTGMVFEFLIVIRQIKEHYLVVVVTII